MSILLCCLGYVATTTLAAPVLLTRGTWQVWHPRTALALWHMSLATSCAVIAYSAIYALGVVGSHADEPRADMTHGVLLTVAVWGGMFVLAALTALFFAHSEPVVRSDHANRERFQQALLASRHHLDVHKDLVVRHLEDDALFAGAFRAPEPTVVVTRGLLECLDEAELEAVIAHERAHLTQRHHFALLLALVNEACLPRFLPARKLHQSTKLLVELIADDTAAKHCGREVTASALAKMAERAGDPGIAARSERLTSPRTRSRMALPFRPSGTRVA